MTPDITPHRDRAIHGAPPPSESSGESPSSPVPAPDPRPERYASAFAIAGLLLATLVVFGPLSRHPGDLLVGPQRAGRNDLSDAFLAFHGYPEVARTRFGERADWNPYSMCGRPWVGNPQAALYYPPNWLYRVWSAPATASWLLVLHHFLAGVGAYCLCRRYGLGQGGALLGGITFLAAPYYLAHTGEGHWNQVCLVAWVPWTLLGFERLRDGQRRALPGTALLLAVTIVCGHAQEAVYLMCILSAFVLADVVNRLWQKRGREACGWCLRWSGAVGLALALAAIELIPNWIYLQQCTRGSGVDLVETQRFCIGLANLRQLLNPFVLGPPDAYFGPGTFYWETVCYFGLLPLALACLAMVVAWRRYPVSRMACLLVLCILFAFGPAAGVYSVLVRCVPPLGMFRVPSRAFFFAALAIAVLAGMGADWLERRVATRYSLRLRRLPLLLVSGLVLLVVADLSRHAWTVLATVPSNSIRTSNPASTYLQQHAGLARVMCSQELLSDREAWAAGLQKAQGYEPVPLVRYLLAVDAATTHNSAALESTGFKTPQLDAYHKPVLDMLGVRFVLTSDSTAGEQDGWRLAAHGWLPGEFTLRDKQAAALPFYFWENTTALPRAYVVGQGRVVPSGADMVTALRAIEPREEVLLTADVLPVGARSEFLPAKVADYTANRVVVEVTLQRPGYLVLSDVWYPGWRAEDNGRPVPVIIGNGAFRAVALQAGSHRVIFQYSSPFFKLAAAISSFALLITIFYWAWPLYRTRSALARLTASRRRRRSCTSPPPACAIIRGTRRNRTET